MLRRFSSAATISIMRKTMKILFIIFLLIEIALPAWSMAKQSHTSGDGQARQVLDAALQALGGVDRLNAITSIMIKAMGREYRSTEVQGYQPNEQTRSEHEETLVVFPAQEKIAFEHRTGRHDGTVRWRRWLYMRDERAVGDFIVERAYQRKASTATERARMARRVPHLLLLEASRNPDRLQLVNNVMLYEGKQHQVISYNPPNEKVTLELFFDAATHLLSKCEYVMDFPALGDVRVEYAYSSYRQDQNLGWIPAGQTIKVAGEILREMTTVEMAANTPQAENIFQLPEFNLPQAEQIFQRPASLKGDDLAAEKIIEAAKGVYVIAISSFTVMFVEFNDFILAVETPAAAPSLDGIPADNQSGSTALSENFIQKIKETIPHKPSKYLAVTHYHSDHAGGARAFMAEGATILTTAGNKKFFEQMTAANYTVIPDRLSRTPCQGSIETFDQKRVITQGERTVELIDVGPNPHTEENVVVYLPKEKILFQGDLFYFDVGDAFPRKDRATILPFFAKWLKKSALAPERIYSVHERGFATMQHVELIL